MGSRTIRTAENRRRFLDCVSQFGNITSACAETGIPRRSIYEWRHDDVAFAADWDHAVRLGTAGLEDIARQRAVNSSDLLMIFMLKALKPEVYRERSTVDLNVTREDYASMPIEEVQRRLDALRAEQGAEPLTIEGNVIRFPTGDDDS